MSELVPRHARSSVVEALADTPIVVLQGARQVGKSTLALDVSSGGGSYVTLDDPTALEAALNDPTSFVDRVPDGCLAIDEVQRAPDLILAIKASVDHDRRPGRFLLTGSANLLRLATTRDTLAGRAESVELYGLSQGELERHRETFVDAVFAGELPIAISGNLRRSEYLTRICAGGYPEAVTRIERRRRSWFDNYVTRITVHDAPDLSNLRRLGEIPALLRLLAAHNASEVSNATLAQGLHISENSVPGYVDLLETIYLVHRLPAWSNNLSRRIARRPKTALLDCGLAARLVNIDATALASDMNPTPAGMLVEAFVIAELRKQISWSDAAPQMFHFRDRNGPEIDVILETSDGRIVAIEVKASATLGRGDFRWLEMMRTRLGQRFVAGIVLYLGAIPHAWSDRLAGIPLSTLWRV